MTRISLAVLAISVLAAPAMAASINVPMTMATPTGPGAEVGSVTFSDEAGGVGIALDLHGLPPGPHGFHIHALGSCAASTAANGTVTPAGAAGGHLDPAMTNMHMGPDGMGHLGDLPLITVGADGSAKGSLKAPHLKSVADVKGHAIMIHAGGDNYADTPAPLGGGGGRMACGVAP